MTDQGPAPIGVIQTDTLVPGHVKEVAAKIQDLEKQGAKKLVLDLRHCATVPMTKGLRWRICFMDKGLMTYTDGTESGAAGFPGDGVQGDDQAAAGGDREPRDGGRAEIAAGALLDTKRAELVGERTYGDASMRQGDSDGRRQRGDSVGGQVLFAEREIDSG